MRRAASCAGRGATLPAGSPATIRSASIEGPGRPAGEGGMMRKLLFALAPFMLFTATAAEARPARCVVASEGNSTWRGACNFLAERGGSFSISAYRGAFLEGISDISVSLISPGVAEVRGLTSD